MKMRVIDAFFDFICRLDPIQGHTLARQAANSGRWEDAPYRAWKDTVNLESHEKLRIAVPFKAFPGKTVYHCHTSEHEDHGMMGILEVRA